MLSKVCHLLLANHAAVEHERSQLSDVWDQRASQSAINLRYLI